MNDLHRSSISTNIDSKQFAQEMVLKKQLNLCIYAAIMLGHNESISLDHDDDFTTRGYKSPTESSTGGLKLNYSYTAIISLLDMILAMHGV